RRSGCSRSTSCLAWAPDSTVLQRRAVLGDGEERLSRLRIANRFGTLAKSGARVLERSFRALLLSAGGERLREDETQERLAGLETADAVQELHSARGVLHRARGV